MPFSCIIPAYNEAERIRNVLTGVCGHSLIDEVIVVDDGSTDNIREILEHDPRIRLISYSPNKGKTHAVLTGIGQSKNENILLLDADLVGLTSVTIDALLVPVESHIADITISLRGNSLPIYKKLGIDIFSGERAFNKKILGDIGDLLQIKGFGLEVFMNNKIINANLRVKIVDLPQLTHVRKQEKFGYWSGLYKEARMIFQVWQTVSIYTVWKQIRGLKKLSVS